MIPHGHTHTHTLLSHFVIYLGVMSAHSLNALTCATESPKKDTRDHADSHSTEKKTTAGASIPHVDDGGKFQTFDM